MPKEKGIPEEASSTMLARSAPIGGYVFILAEPAEVGPLAGYAMIVAIFGTVITWIKRKRK